MGFKWCNPCPCMELQKAVKILAIIDLVFTVINGIFIVALGSMALADNPEKSEKTVAILTITIGTVLAVLVSLLAYMLYLGAKKSNISHVKSWLYITITLALVNFAWFIYNCATGTPDGPYIASSLAGIAYKVFEMSVVYAFIRELFAQNSQGNGQNPPEINQYNL